MRQTARENVVKVVQLVYGVISKNYAFKVVQGASSENFTMIGEDLALQREICYNFDQKQRIGTVRVYLDDPGPVDVSEYAAFELSGNFKISEEAQNYVINYYNSSCMCSFMYSVLFPAVAAFGGTLEVARYVIEQFQRICEVQKQPKTQNVKFKLTDFVAKLRDYQYIKAAELNQMAEEMFGPERGQRVIGQAKYAGLLINWGKGVFKVLNRFIY